MATSTDDLLQKIANIATIAGPVTGAILNRNAAGAATNELTSGVDQAMGTIKPYATAGTNALNQVETGVKPGGGLADPFSYTMKDFENDPTYKFDFGEGTKAINTAAAARGLYGSSGTVKNLTRYATGLAQKYYGEDYARSENTFRQNQADRFNRLMGITNVGQTATKQIADLEGQKAEALAIGDIAKANATTGAIADATNAVGDIAKVGQTTKQVNDIVSAIRNAGAPTTGAALAAQKVASLGGSTVPTGAALTSQMDALPAATSSAAPAVGGAGIGTTAAILGGAGVLLNAGLAWKSSQIHQTADAWVNGEGGQKDFDTYMAVLGQKEAAGQISPEQASQLRTESAQNYLQKLYEFANSGANGSEKVSQQALDSFTKFYGDPAQYGIKITLPEHQPLTRRIIRPGVFGAAA